MHNLILFADNNEEVRVTWERLLVNAGFRVRLAGSPNEARVILENMTIDLAVLDLKLEDDNAPNDFSGILLAKERAYRHVPKIILTAYPTDYAHLREALNTDIDDLPPTVAFVDKAEAPKVLIELIRSTLDRWPQLRRSATKVSDQIKRDHEDARHQSQTSYRAAQNLSVAGGIIILTGIMLAYFDHVTIGLVSTAGGIITEVMSYLFFSRVNLANRRMDTYHRELLQTYWAEFLLAVCEELPHDKRTASIEHVIATASDNWLTRQPSSANAKLQEVHL